VARAASTSQSAIARIEAGEENITLKTLGRLITALGGRLIISIQPKEMPVFRQPQWWEIYGANLSATNWQVRGWDYRETEGTQQIVIGAERNKAATPLMPKLIEESANGN
jgi:hypothetical protein